MNDLLLAALIAAGCCAVVGGAGVVALRWSRRAPVTGLLVLAALVPVAAVVVAVLVNLDRMFVSAHDSQVLLVTLAASSVLSLGIALLVGRWLVVSSNVVGEGLRALPDGLADGWTPAPSAAVDAPAEMRKLGDELVATRRRLDEALQRQRALEESRRELVAFFSHDLRTPLAGLRALAEGLEDGVVDDVPGALVRMRLSVGRMSGLVDDLLELSRLQATPRERHLVAVDLGEVAADAAGELEASARASDVRLDVVLRERLPVVGEPHELTRAVANLLANALRHTPPGGRVALTGTRANDGRVQLVVEDACGGIPDEDLPRVFDVGWRGTPERGTSGGGGGLGLAITRGVAESHAGTVAVANVGDGCRFELALPAAR